MHSAGLGSFFLCNGDRENRAGFPVSPRPPARILRPMTSRFDTFSHRAAECLDQAQRSADAETKALFLEMAEQWLSLAEASAKNPHAAPFHALVG